MKTFIALILHNCVFLPYYYVPTTFSLSDYFFVLLLFLLFYWRLTVVCDALPASNLWSFTDYPLALCVYVWCSSRPSGGACSESVQLLTNHWRWATVLFFLCSSRPEQFDYSSWKQFCILGKPQQFNLERQSGNLVVVESHLTLL